MGNGAEGHRAIGVDDGSTQVRHNRDPGQPTASEYKLHVTTHRPYRSWCKFCVMGSGVKLSSTGDQISQDDMEGECSLCRWVVVVSLVRRNLKIR